MPKVHVGAADFGACRPQQTTSCFEIGPAELTQLNGLQRGGHDCREDAVVHARTLLCDVYSRICFLALAALCAASSVSAQTTHSGARPRRHFVTVSYDSLYTQPLHFADHPLSDLLDRDVASVQAEAFDYQTRDGATSIDVVEFSRRARGAGISVYPLGMSTGPALMLRASIEQLPRVRLSFEGPAPVGVYELTDARARDFAAGLIVADRSPGWGLGSHAFVVGGIGKITSGLGDGSRYFAEGGGGLGVGPIGVELGIKFAWNTLSEPVNHKFLTIPVTLRGTLTF